MTEPQNSGSTPTLLTWLLSGISDVLEKIGLGPPATLIHNESDKPIFLIPFSRIAGDAGSGSIIFKEDLARKIPAKKTILVYSSRYDCSGVNPTLEISILFRAGSNNTDVTEFLGNLNPEVVKKEKRLFSHRDLRNKHHLYLTYKEGKVMEDKNAGQEVSALENLSKEVASLKNEVEVLKDKMESLRKFLENIEAVVKSRAGEMRDLCANLDPSLSTITPSSSN